MKKLLLIGLTAGVLAFVPAQRSDAGVSIGIGMGPGYTMATIMGLHSIGTADTGITTATIVTTIITGTKVT